MDDINEDRGTIDWAASVDCERHFIYGYTLREKPAAT